MSVLAEQPSDWRGRRVLLSGATSSIGLNLLPRLQGLGAEVHALVRPPAQSSRLPTAITPAVIHSCDMIDRGALVAAFAASAPDVVFHLATPRLPDVETPPRLVEINVTAATLLVAELCRRPETTMIVAGSGLEYGPAERPHKETDPLRPSSWFGLSKAAASLVYRLAVADMGLRITQLRPFHVYGPWEKPHRLLPTAISAALEGRGLALTRERICRDWIYVDDVVEAFLLAAARPIKGGIFNIGSGSMASNEEIVALVENAVGRRISRLPGDFPPRVTDVAPRCADLGTTLSDLGWSPRMKLDDGIAATIAWRRAQIFGGNNRVLSGTAHG